MWKKYSISIFLLNTENLQRIASFSISGIWLSETSHFQYTCLIFYLSHFFLKIDPPNFLKLTDPRKMMYLFLLDLKFYNVHQNYNLKLNVKMVKFHIKICFKNFLFFFLLFHLLDIIWHYLNRYRLLFFPHMNYVNWLYCLFVHLFKH